MIKTSPSNAGGAVSNLGWGSKIPHASLPRNQDTNNRNKIVTNSTKTLKMAHIKKIKEKILEKM